MQTKAIDKMTHQTHAQIKEDTLKFLLPFCREISKVNTCKRYFISEIIRYTVWYTD